MENSKSFIKGVFSEMKMVSWPSKPEVWASTKVVIAFSLLFVLFVFGVDQAIKWIVALMM